MNSVIWVDFLTYGFAWKFCLTGFLLVYHGFQFYVFRGFERWGMRVQDHIYFFALFIILKFFFFKL